MSALTPVSNVQCALGLLLISALSSSTAAVQHRTEGAIATAAPTNVARSLPYTSLLAQAEPGLVGVYSIQQQSTQRYLDAHDTADRDFAVVTRTHQANTTQRWIIKRPIQEAAPVPPSSAGACTVFGRVEGRRQADESCAEEAEDADGVSSQRAQRGGGRRD